MKSTKGRRSQNKRIKGFQYLDTLKAECPEEISLPQLHILEQGHSLEYGWKLSGWGVKTPNTEEERRVYQEFREGKKKITLIPITKGHDHCQYGAVDQTAFFTLLKNPDYRVHE